MREVDRKAFLDTADHFKVWIFARVPNPGSIAYIGNAACVPKPIDCKAKTADRDVKAPREIALAGLVVSPLVQPGAFSPERYRKALADWKNEFARNGRLPANYDIDMDPKSGHTGAVRLHGRYLHADYDLYAIVDPLHSHRHITRYDTMRGQPHQVDPRYEKVIVFLNKRIDGKVEMVQHHPWWQGGRHSDETILYFSPGRKEGTLKGHDEIARFFERTFYLREHPAPWDRG